MYYSIEYILPVLSLMSSSNPKDAPQSIDDHICQTRLAKDLAQRTAKCFFAYPILWLAIGLGSGWAQQHLEVFWCSQAYLTGMALVRAWHIKQLDPNNATLAKQWIAQVRFLAGAHTLVWGCLVAYSLQDLNSNMFVYMAMSTAGIVPLATDMFAPDLKSSQIYIGTTLLPCIAFTVVGSQQWALVGLLTVYIIFLAVNARRQSASYFLMLKNELALAKLSRTDPLTQIGNRLFFDEQLERMANIASRNNNWLSVAIVDLDHFKRINDEHGHDVGDACLQHLANILASSLNRSTDICARYGGEEFVMVYPGMTPEAAETITERLRESIEQTSYSHSNINVTMTASIGCVSHLLNETDRDTTQELLKQADSALYTAKSRGRNRCEFRMYDQQTQSYCSAIGAVPLRSNKLVSIHAGSNSTH